jgi:peptidyl-tRNA hydrolase, PTH1 family
MESKKIKVIIGLGNPGHQFEYNRHNIGFLVADALIDKYNGAWQNNDLMDYASVNIDGQNVFVIKPQTFMNSSGKISLWLKKKGIKDDEVIVVQDDLEKPFGAVSIKEGGSARGHNGVKSLMELFGANFYRLRCGIGRPEKKSEVADYVLSNFIEGEDLVGEMIQESVKQIEESL